MSKGNSNTKSLAYTSLVRPILEYGAAYWDPCRLDRVQTKAAQITDHTKNCDWETLDQRKTIARLCTHFKAYSAERAWKAIRDRVRRPCCLSLSCSENLGQEAKNG
jgi:hypothetical protein